MLRSAALSFAFVFYISGAGAAEPQLKVFGQVRVEGLSSITEQELLYLLDIRAGGLFEPGSVREGIKRAFRKGIFESISVEHEDGGVLVRVRERDRVVDIKVRGNKRVYKRIIRRHLIIKKRGLMRYDLLEKAEKGLAGALADRGFPDARVRLTVLDTDEPYGKTLLVQVEEGEPLLIRKIKVFGWLQREVTGRMRLGEGSEYDQFRLKDDLERLEAYYRKLGYLAPTVGPYTFGSGTLYLSVHPGTRLDVRFEGNSNVTSRALMAELPFYEVGEVTDDLVVEAVANLGSLYRERGYGSVQIAPVMSAEDEAVSLVFYFYEGAATRVGDVSIKGTSLPEKNLKSIMSLKKGEPFSPDALEADMESLENFYHALGYLDARVREPAVELKGDVAGITVSVTEGRRYEIAVIKFEGLRSLTEKALLDAMGIKAGSPYNEVDLFDARYAVLGMYAQEGFTETKAVVRREFNENMVTVVFDVTEGARTFFGKTVVSGNHTTRLKVIEREFLHREGMPFRYKLLTRGRQKLYRLGIFDDIDIETLPARNGTVDVSVRVKEGKPGAVELGIGYGEYEEYRGFVDLSYGNLFGLNRSVSLRLELSSLESRYILKYYEPWFMDRPIRFNAFVMREKREEKNIDTGETNYRILRYSASVGVERPIGDRLKAELTYEFSLVETTDVMPDVILSKEDTGTLAISGIKPGIVYDTRDNPINPTRGVFAGLLVKLASGVILSETDFLKLIVHGSTYLPLHRRLVLAGSARFGGAFGFGDTDELPLVERFFLGGRNTVRGYEQDSLGPRGSLGTPMGGNAFLLGNLELRATVGRGWGLVAFLDGGNVWGDVGDFDPLDIKATAGFGVRYNTPVGPLRLDYGHKLDREEGESKGEVHFSIGHAF